jgi:hypothetical protein
MMLRRVSDLQILQLTHNFFSTDNIQHQLHLASQLQEQFQSWSIEKVLKYHNVLSETPLHLEIQQILNLEPNLPWELLYIVIELLKLPSEELKDFKEWITALTKNELTLFVQLLELPAASLLDLKNRFGWNEYMFPEITESIETSSISSTYYSSAQSNHIQVSPSSSIIGRPMTEYIPPDA